MSGTKLQWAKLPSARAPFTNMAYIQSQRVQVTATIMKCAMKLFIYCQKLTVSIFTEFTPFLCHLRHNIFPHAQLYAGMRAIPYQHLWLPWADFANVRYIQTCLQLASPSNLMRHTFYTRERQMLPLLTVFVCTNVVIKTWTNNYAHIIHCGATPTGVLNYYLKSLMGNYIPR